MVGSDSESESIVRVEQSTGAVAAGTGVSEAEALEDEDDPEQPASARQAAAARTVRLRGVRRTWAPCSQGRIREDGIRRDQSVEGLSASAASGGVGIVNGEALLLDAVGEVDGGTRQVGHAHTVDDDLDAVHLTAPGGEGAHCVTVQETLIEVELVDQAGAASGLDGHAQAQVITPLLGQEAGDLRSGGLGEDDLVLRGLGVGGVGQGGLCHGHLLVSVRHIE